MFINLCFYLKNCVRKDDCLETIIPLFQQIPFFNTLKLYHSCFWVIAYNSFCLTHAKPCVCHKNVGIVNTSFCLNVKK